jgi:hypothetical protein
LTERIELAEVELAVKSEELAKLKETSNARIHELELERNESKT